MKKHNMKTQSFGRLCRTAFVSIVAGLSAVSAWAHATLAAWDGFKNVADGDTRHGVLLHLEGNTVNADGSITIGSRGLWLTRTCGTFGNAATGSELGVTVIAEVSDVPVPASGIGGLLSVPIINLAETWAGVDAGGKVTLSWGAGSPETAATVLSSGTHFVALGYKNGKGSGVIVDGVEVVTSTASSSGGMLQSEIHVGEHKTYGSPEISGVLTGMTVKRLAIVNDRLTADEVVAYCANGIGLPDATQQADYARFQANFADRVFTWRSTVMNATDVTYAKFGRFDLETGMDASVVGSNDKITMPGFEAPITDLVYRGFSSVYAPDGPYGAYYGYSAPGLVLRFPAWGGDYNPSMQVALPLSLGGLIVEEGAYGGFNDNASAVSPITLATDANDRTTDLGDPRGSVPTWFILHENVVMNRGGETKVYGEANFVIDVGKTFDCTSAKNANAIFSLQAGASLVCHGKGQLKVRTLTATAEGACLDWSNLEIDNAHPFIDGNLTVAATTKLVFPVSTKEIALCSGTLSGSFPNTVQVGDETVSDFIVSGNRIILSTTSEFIGEGETNWNTPGAWTAGVPQAGDYARIPSGKTVVISASDDLSGVHVIGEGRVIYVNRQPGSERTSYCESAWTGTVEIRNLHYSDSTPTLDQVLDFSAFSNAKSSIALNGVTSGMWTHEAYVKNPTFRDLEIGPGGWTSTTTSLGASPVYSCNLIGTGTLTSQQSESGGTANFIGDHSAFAGSVVNVSGTRQVALLKTGATALGGHGGSGAQVILIGEGVNLTVAENRILEARLGIDIRGAVCGAGTMTTSEGSLSFNGGAVRTGSGALTLDGAINGSPAVDAKSAFDSCAFDDVEVLVSKTEAKPDFVVRSAPGFAAVWKGDELWIRDVARIALYGNYVGKSVLTWDGMETLTTAGKQRYVGFAAETLTDTEEVLTADDSWQVFYYSQAAGSKYRPGAVLRLARGHGTPMNIDNFVPWCFGGIVVEPGATGYSLTINSGTRDITFGDRENAVGVSWTTICENFTVNRGPQGHGTFFGVCNLYVDAGKVFSFNANTETRDNPVVNPGATLKLHGEGTLKVSNLIATDATLDFSDLADGRATPFVDGALTINRKTVIVFPDGFDIAGSYQLCSGTLNAPARPFTATVVVDGVSQRRKISVSGNCVSCSDPDGMSVFIR